MKKLTGIFLIVVVAIAVAMGIGIYNTPTNRINRHLDLGQKYLEEQNYEQALIEFNKAIEIDPMNVEAYLGKVQVYENRGDIEEAIKVLQTGYEVTNDIRLKDYIDKLSVVNGKDTIQVEDDLIDNIEQNEELKQKLEQSIYDLLHNEEYNYLDIQEMCRGYICPIYSNCCISDEQMIGICTPLVSEIEEYIELTGDRGINEYGYMLPLCYYVLGEYDKCLEMRRQLYKITEESIYSPEGYTLGDTIYDQYGNIIATGNGESEYIYGVNGRLSCIESKDRISTYEYGTDGRLFKSTTMFSNGDKQECVYQYMGNTVVIHSYSDNRELYSNEYEIDKYGDIVLGD